MIAKLLRNNNKLSGIYEGINNIVDTGKSIKLLYNDVDDTSRQFFYSGEGESYLLVEVFSDNGKQLYFKEFNIELRE